MDVGIPTAQQVKAALTDRMNKNFQLIMKVAAARLGLVMDGELHFPLSIHISETIHPLTVDAARDEFRRSGYKVEHTYINSQKDGPVHTFTLRPMEPQHEWTER